MVSKQIGLTLVQGHSCGSIGGIVNPTRKRDTLTDSIESVSPRQLGAMVIDVIQLVKNCMSTGHVSPAMGARISEISSKLLTSHTKILLGMEVECKGAKTDAYMALLQTRADLNDLINPSAGQSGAC